MRIKRKYILLILVIVAISICFYVFITSKTARTLKTMYYFTRSALASVNSQPKNYKTLPAFEKIKYPDGETQTDAWLFKPKSSKSRSAVILSPGVGLNYDTLILIMNIADSLRKAGITAIVPFPDDLKVNIITQRSIESYKNAFIFLEDQGYIDKSKIGFIGFCVGSDISLLAAANPQISSRVSYIASFSAYSDLKDYYAEVISGKTPGPNSRPWKTLPSVYNIGVENVLYRLSNENDKNILRNILIDGKNASAKVNLTPQGQNAFQILTSKNPEFIKQQLPQISADSANDLRILSPVNFTDQIQAPVYMFHDKNDFFEPVEESRRLSQTFGNKAVYFETDLLDHTVLRSNISITTWLTQGPKMVSFLYKIFSKTS